MPWPDRRFEWSYGAESGTEHVMKACGEILIQASQDRALSSAGKAEIARLVARNLARGRDAADLGTAWLLTWAPVEWARCARALEQAADG